MNRRSILTKTGKGLMEATGKTSNLSRDLRNILKEIDGKVSVSDLSEKFGKLSEAKLLEALSSMEKDGYLREFVGKQDDGPSTPVGRAPASRGGPASQDGSDLDFTAFTPAKPNAKANEDARLQAQAQEIARQAQATRAREEAAAKARAEIAARTKAEPDLKAKPQPAQPAPPKPSIGFRTGANAPLPPLINPSIAPAPPPVVGILGAGPEAAARAQADAAARTQAVELERARREAEEKARRDAEEKARRDAEERVRREIEERVKRETEERKLREIAEKARREEEEKARREAEARAKREAEERAKREAEERLRREMEERAKREIEERMRREEAERRAREEQERARREAEERERRTREEEERVRREAERQTRIEAEAKARVEGELRSKRDSEERGRREEEERRQAQLRKRAEDEEGRRREQEEAEALERSVIEEQERATREAEEASARGETERKEEEEKAAEEAEQAEREREETEERAKEDEKRARREAKEQAKVAAKARKAERARERAGVEAWRGDEDAARDPNAPSAAAVWQKRRPRSIAKAFATLLLVALVVGVAVLPFVPLETAPYEKSAQAWLDQPVKIGAVYLTLLPLPQLKFEKVAIGRDPQLKIGVVKASPELTTLLEDRILLRSLELDNVTLPREFLGVLLRDKAARKGLGAQRVTARGLKIDAQELGLPPLDLEAKLSTDGALRSASFTNAEQRLSINIEPQGGKATVDISSGTLPLPIGIDIGLTEFTGKGTASANELVIPNAEARAFGGRVFGNLRLRWSSGWSLDGDLSARQMDAAKIAGPLIGSGTVLGKGKVSMRGLLPERMVLNAQLEGNFSIQKGSVSNVDMTRLLQGSGSGGGTTFFAEMNGDFSADPNRLLVRNVRLAAGLLTGTGQLEMDSQKNLSGRMQIELRAQSVQARSTLNLAGTLANPQFRRTN